MGHVPMGTTEIWRCVEMTWRELRSERRIGNTGVVQVHVGFE
jgi:hypothetical protein